MTSQTFASASTVRYTKATDHKSVYSLPAQTENGIFIIYADDQPAFCIQHSKMLIQEEAGFTKSELTIPEKDRLSLIAYYGYHQNPSPVNYGITQSLIWETLGSQLVSTEIPDFQNQRQIILDKVNKHSIKPSFINQTIELNIGDSIELTDTNNALERYAHLTENSANLKIEKKGNKLKLTATKDSKESGNLQYSIANQKYVGTSFVYEKEPRQSTSVLKLKNAGLFNLPIKVNPNGNARIRKIDQTTGLPLQNVKIELAYHGKKIEALTNKQGFIELNDIKAGTEITVTELEALDGYFNHQISKKIVIKSKQTIDLVLENMPQQGIATLKKVGKVPIDFEEKETEHGLLHEFNFDYKSLQNVSYEI
ncbi:thioester domain-containing protein [Enterococcus plantarum]|uniref:thioester domain-containing protein n=1 Tax=Enterococcus plantarum TaxID=1077675 RepID=UPI001A8FEDDC|nr:thioester domain-containing protein [Enterococcus plantarum]MBO0468570.1 thioester domain-containing protein [Enterococcus plantarum]